MDSCSKQANLRDSKDTLVGVEDRWEDVVPSRGSVLHSSMRWLIIVTVLMGFVLMFFVVARQQIQINTMQLELDSLLHYEIDQIEHNYMDEELKNNETETEGVIPRQRRQVGNSRSQDSVQFAHLIQIQNTPGANRPYLWARPSSSRYSVSNAYYSNVQLYPSSGGSHVQAINVARSGWYYVYSQIPYKFNEDDVLGHKIVKVGNCGNGVDVPVLQTMTQLPYESNSRYMQNWKYLGGIVHLAAGDSIEVRPVTDLTIDQSWLHGGQQESQTGGYFGLFEVQLQLPVESRICHRP
ncbi:hypothetical protein HOLleu_26501 [Holothuria leucospilota]|uniref:THD domain-containing protein n=1 Tax=Holothuria leucospilota TaxID=206669 RepID=A0A9Q1BPB0_HOLLE|nr:hypothetical protein HOLleu_26501 [Holothuria leucospilota]